MPKKRRRDDSKRGNPGPPIERTDERSSPGSGGGDEAADIQPDEVENDTAR